MPCMHEPFLHCRKRMVGCDSFWLFSFMHDSLSRESFFASISCLFMDIRMREYVRREHIRPVLRFLIRIGIVVGVILLFNVIGLWASLFSQGLWNLHRFTELLAILLLLEGSVICAAGAFMFYGYSEHRLMGQAALWPTLAGDQARRWTERRLSQQKWGIAMLIAGVLLILLFLLVSSSTSILNYPV